MPTDRALRAFSTWVFVAENRGGAVGYHVLSDEFFWAAWSVA